MVEGLINDIVSETSHMDTSTVVKDNNKMTAVSKLGKTKLVVVHENNNGAMKLADTGLKSNNTLSAHIVEEKEGWFYEQADNYDVITLIHLRKRMDRGAHTRSQMTTAFLNSPRPNTTRNRKQES